MELGYEVPHDLGYDVAPPVVADESGDTKTEKSDGSDKVVRRNSSNQCSQNSNEKKDSNAKPTQTDMQELSRNMRRASFAYRRASLQMRRASLCPTSNSNDGSAAEQALVMNLNPGTPNDASCCLSSYHQRRESIASIGGYSACSDLTADSTFPSDIDLGYGLPPSYSACDIAAFYGGGEPTDYKLDKDGNLSALSYHNRKASIEYRRASLALRRASACSSSRRISACSGGLSSLLGAQARRDSDVGSVSTEGSDIPKGVYFGEVEILEFPLIKGDNPACKEGCPTTLDWKPVSHQVEDILYYEYGRGARRRGRDLKIPKEDRTCHLMSVGYTMDDVVDMEDECRKIRKERLETLRLAKQNNEVDDNYKTVFARYYKSLENSIKDPKTSLLKFFPNTVERVGRRVSSAVTTTAHRLSFAANKKQHSYLISKLTEEPQPLFQVAAIAQQ